MFKRLLLYLFCISALLSSSQTRKRNYRQKEIGIFAGASYYIGDINPRKHFFYSQPAVGAFYRMAMSYRYAFRFGFNYGRVGATDAKSGEPNQLERNLSFRTDIYEGHALYEFNFVDYRIGNDKHIMSLFLFAGLGMYYFNPQANIGNGYKNLEELKTEGQAYSKIQMNMPFGIGFKWNISYIFGLSFEWGPRKLFTDYLDDVSNTYPLNGGSIYSGSGAGGTMRGNPRTKDWYFFYGFTLNMRLPKKRAECHGMGLGS